MNKLCSFKKQSNRDCNIPLLHTQTGHVTNSATIAKELHSYFCSIGPTIANSMNGTAHSHFQYHDKSILNSFVFNDILPLEIVNEVRQIKANKATMDSFNIKVVKEIVHIIAQPLCHMFNLSIKLALCLKN